MNYIDNIDDLLLKHRSKNKMSQTEVAIKLGVRQATVADWERRAAKPSLKNLVKIYDFLNLGPGFTKEDDMRKGFNKTGNTDLKMGLRRFFDITFVKHEWI